MKNIRPHQGFDARVGEDPTIRCIVVCRHADGDEWYEIESSRDGISNDAADSALPILLDVRYNSPNLLADNLFFVRQIGRILGDSLIRAGP